MEQRRAAFSFARTTLALRRRFKHLLAHTAGRYPDSRSAQSRLVTCGAERGGLKTARLPFLGQSKLGTPAPTFVSIESGKGLLQSAWQQCFLRTPECFEVCKA